MKEKSFKSRFIQDHKDLVKKYINHKHDFKGCPLCIVSRDCRYSNNIYDGICEYCTLTRSGDGGCLVEMETRKTLNYDSINERDFWRAKFHTKVVEYLKTLPARDFVSIAINTKRYAVIKEIDATVYKEYLKAKPIGD